MWSIVADGTRCFCKVREPRVTLLGQHDEAMHRAEPDSFSARARAREGAREEERKLERDRERGEEREREREGDGQTEGERERWGGEGNKNESERANQACNSLSLSRLLPRIKF